jgi:hypothetical protein
MKSELSFLTDLFLNEEVTAPVRKIVAARMKEVEKALTQPDVPRGTQIVPQFLNNAVGTPPPGSVTGIAQTAIPPHIAKQSPSMQKIMLANPDLIPKAAQVEMAQVPPPSAPPAPTTGAAAMALQARNALIHKGITSNKPEDGRSGPRKA